jgi:hypothetical protein
MVPGIKGVPQKHTLEEVRTNGMTTSFPMSQLSICVVFIRAEYNPIRHEMHFKVSQYIQFSAIVYQPYFLKSLFLACKRIRSLFLWVG